MTFLFFPACGCFPRLSYRLMGRLLNGSLLLPGNTFRQIGITYYRMMGKNLEPDTSNNVTSILIIHMITITVQMISHPGSSHILNSRATWNHFFNSNLLHYLSFRVENVIKHLPLAIIVSLEITMLCPFLISPSLMKQQFTFLWSMGFDISHQFIYKWVKRFIDTRQPTYLLNRDIVPFLIGQGLIQCKLKRVLQHAIQSYFSIFITSSILSGIFRMHLQGTTGNIHIANNHLHAICLSHIPEILLNGILGKTISYG